MSMKSKLKIFYVSPEVAPFAETNNLAEVASSYSRYVKSQGHDIRVMMPNYRAVNERKYVLRDVIRLKGLSVKLGEETFDANGKSAFIPNSKVQIYFLDNRELFGRDIYYADMLTGDEFQDNARRFVFFAHGCIETLKLLYWQPDVIHCNDWQTALIPFLLKTKYANDPFFKNTKTLFTIHNPSSRGVFKESAFAFSGLADLNISSFVKNGEFSFLDLGVDFSDSFNLTGSVEENGGATKTGVVIENGIDDQVWDPETDKLIPANYNVEDLSGKETNKTKLLEDFDLSDLPEKPVVGIFLNPNDEKTAKVTADSLEELLSLDIKLIVAGDASPAYKDKFDSAKDISPDKIGVEWTPDAAKRHLLEAGSDMLVGPSFPEQTLAPLTSLAYGTVPVLFSDSVEKRMEAYNADSENGFSFICNNADSDSLINKLKEAIAIFEDKEKWSILVKCAMKQDFSWETLSQDYLKLYGGMLNSKGAKK